MGDNLKKWALIYGRALRFGYPDPEIGLFSRPDPVRNADFFTSGPRTFLDVENMKKIGIEVLS